MVWKIANRFSVRSIVPMKAAPRSTIWRYRFGAGATVEPPFNSIVALGMEGGPLGGLQLVICRLPCISRLNSAQNDPLRGEGNPRSAYRELIPRGPLLKGEGESLALCNRRALLQIPRPSGEEGVK